MKNSLNSSAQQPMIVKYVEALHNGIQSQALSRYAIGYILRGTKYIYEGDKRQTLTRGDVFYLGIGHHYIENFPENGQPFEQVLFYYNAGGPPAYPDAPEHHLRPEHFERTFV